VVVVCVVVHPAATSQLSLSLHHLNLPLSLMNLLSWYECHCNDIYELFGYLTFSPLKVHRILIGGISILGVFHFDESKTSEDVIVECLNTISAIGIALKIVFFLKSHHLFL